MLRKRGLGEDIAKREIVKARGTAQVRGITPSGIQRLNLTLCG